MSWVSEESRWYVDLRLLGTERKSTDREKGKKAQKKVTVSNSTFRTMWRL